ncbi:uncharacterized protein LOC143518424 [Brachyhypopomus gauderio]|uniref:uncharacterized protein LOC143518424 n=1 Tax=Brachyhypopomus gauderio TaxID=698409 RepID=UPI0040428A96
MSRNTPSHHRPSVPLVELKRLQVYSGRTGIMSKHVSVTAPKCPLCLGSDTVKLNGHRAMCRRCSKSKRAVYSFCWACLREWPNSAKADGCCRLANCALRAALLSDERITDTSSRTKGCPFFRACPECNTLVTHNGVGCPNVTCPRCSTEFCFRCLRQECFGTGELHLPTWLPDFEFVSMHEALRESRRESRHESWFRSWLGSLFQPRLEPRVESRLESLEVWCESWPEPCSIVDNSRSLEALGLQEQS